MKIENTDGPAKIEFTVKTKDGDQAVVTVTGYRDPVTALTALLQAGKPENVQRLAAEYGSFYDDDDYDDEG